MSRFRCFDTYNLKNISSSQRTSEVRRKTIFTEYQTIAIGNVNFQKGLTDNAIPPGYTKKQNGSYFYGPIYVSTDDIALNNCLVGAKNYELLYDVLFGAQTSPDDIKYSIVTYDGAAWQGNIFKTDTKTVGTVGPAITNVPNGVPDKTNYAARQDFLPNYNEYPNPPEQFPGIVIDPCYNMFYPRCANEYVGNNYIKNVKFNFTNAELENSELVNYLKTSSATRYTKFPYQLNFQNTTCEKYPFSFVFSFINTGSERANDILLKYMPLININNTISYDITYSFSGIRDEKLTYTINFKYTGAPSDVDGLTFYPNGPSDTSLVDFYNSTTDFTIHSFNLMPLSPLGYQFKNLKFILSATDIPIIKPNTSLDEAFKGTIIRMPENTNSSINNLMRSFMILDDFTINVNRTNSISNWRTSGVISMNSTFMDSNFNGELNGWITSNVLDMRSIFENNKSFNQYINDWNISKINDMNRMFSGATSFNQPLNNWNTINVVNMNSVFKGASSFNQDLNNWKTDNVTNMSEMFMNATSFNGKINNWNTENVEDMSFLFKNASSFNQNISYDNELNYWNTYNVQTFESIFQGTQKFNNGQEPLTSSIFEETNPLNWVNIYNFSPNSSYPKTANITLNSAYDATGLTRKNAFPFSKPYTVLYEYYDNSGTTFNDIRDNYLPYIITGLSVLSNLEITPPEPIIGYRMVKFAIMYNSTDENTGISFYEENDKKINYYNQVGSGNFIRILNFDSIPLTKNGHQFSKLINLDISSSSIVTIEPNTSLNDAFSGTTNLKISNIEFWKTENVVNMSNMFKNSSFNEDLSEWNTSNVEDMSSMFENNTIFNQDLSKWNTDKVVNMSRMFKNASSFNSRLTYYSDSSNNYWDVSGVLNMSSMFENALSFNNGKKVGESIEKLNWTLNPLVNYTHVRTNAVSLTNDNAFPLPYFYTMKYEFYNKNNRSNEDISNNIPILIAGPSTIINTNVTDDTKPNYKLVETTVSFPNHIQDLSSGFSFINVKSFFNETYGGFPHKITQFGGIPLARNNNLSPPNGYQFADLSCVIDFSANDSFSILPNTTLSYCFYNNKFFDSYLNWDTSEVISMKSMFEESAFNKFIDFNTNRVIDMSNMFKNSEFNQTISYSENSSYWDVRNVLDMTSIFENASRFNNGFDVGEKTHPLNWNLNPNVKALDCIKNANAISYENAYPLAEIIGQFTYKFYNTENLTSIDISNSYLPIIKTSDINLNYYYSPLITTNPSDQNKLTTVTVYFRYNNISSNVIDGLSFNNVSSVYNANTRPKIITNFSNIPLARENGSNEGKQFSNINHLIFDSDTNPTILPNTTFKDIFNNSFFNYDINKWNIEGVISLNGAFANTPFNKPLNNWNTSNVVDMSGVFYNNKFFNQPIGTWNVSNVNTMENMFYNCLNFNQNLSNWNTMNVYTFNHLFFNCNKFNNGDVIGESNIPLTWNTSNLQNLRSTFYKARSFNQDISGWNTSNVTTIENLFREAEYFNQPIGSWNVSNVSNMKNVFYDATMFNQPIGNWNTRNVTTMESMFRNAASFNKNISFNILNNSWDTSNVLNMSSIFEGTNSFNNGFEIGDIDNPLNWNLNPSVNTINATVNASFLSVSNAKPLEKIIKGIFVYTFYNNTNESDEDILDKYIPIINKNNSFIEFISSISHPLAETDISFTKVEIFYSYVDVDNSNNIDGLTFFDVSGIKTGFYNSTQNKLTILNFGSIPLSREGYQFANLNYFDVSLNIDDRYNNPTILFNTSLKYAFYNTNFEINNNIDIQNWDTIFVNDMTSMFENSSFNKPIRINTKNVKIMNSMFKNAINFNQNISYDSLINVNIWNTSNVIDMAHMFDGASSFNNGEIEEETTQPLHWILNPLVDLNFVRINTPKLTNKNSFPLPSIYTLKYNFYDNTGISGDYIINNYVPIILNGKSMFYNTSVIPYENIKSKKNVTIELAYMNDISNTGLSFYDINNKIVDFYNNNNDIPLTITQFDNIPLSRNDGSEPQNGYQFSNLNLIDFSANDTLTILPNTTLSYCFFNSINFNSDINNWDLSNVESTKSMFEGATSFNKPLQNWNTSNIKNMESMFKNASSFNQTIKYNPDLNYWDVSSVTNMISIFEGATNFNNGFPPYNYDGSLNWILNKNVIITNSYTNALVLTDYNGLPLTSSIYYPDEFIYKFYNVHNETTKNILFNYLPFIKTNNLIFDISKNVIVEQVSNTSQETLITVRFSFSDDGITQDGLNFNATPDIVYFYNITEQPVEIIQFGNMPLSRYYNNKDQLFWETTFGTKFNSFGYSVTSGNNKWISVGGIKTNTILRSLDARNWQNVSGTTFNGIGYAVLNGNGTTWIAVGDDYGGPNTILRSNDDGETWFSVSGIKCSYAGHGIAYGNNRWLVVGDDNKGQNTILTSTNDGETWSSVTGISFSLAGFGIEYNGIDRWVAVGAGTHTILTSTDGNNWVDVSGVQFGLYGQSVLHRFGRWVAIGHDNYGYNTILTSTNGTYWYPVSGTTFSSYGQSLAYGNGRWVAVGYDNGGPNTILTSTNGIDWSECLFGTFTFAGYGVSYMERYNLWVAVGDNSLNYNSILMSSDGIQWYPVIGSKFKFTGYGIANNNNEWASVGYHYTYTFGVDVESLDNPTYEGTGPYPQSAPIDETNALSLDDDSLLVFKFKLERSSSGVIAEIGGSANGSCITIFDNENTKTLQIYHFKSSSPKMNIDQLIDIDKFVGQNIQLVLYLIRDNITGFWSIKVIINNELVHEYSVNINTTLAGGNFTSVGGIDPDTTTLSIGLFRTTADYNSPFYSHKLWYSTLLDNTILYCMV